MKQLHDLCKAHLAARPDCAAYLPAFAGKSTGISGPSPLKRADSGGLEAGVADLADAATDETRPLVDGVAHNRTSLDWWSTYTEADMAGRGMATGMSACQFCGPGAPFDAPDGRAGFFYVKDDVEYAAHRHEPDEIYAILAGRARFWNEATGWAEAGAGDIIQTPSWSWHGMTTDQGPVLIMWAWIGADYDVYPEMRDATGALPPG